MTLAPIVVFVYNRPGHTEQTLRALSENELAKDSLLFIYADGPKDNATEEDLLKIKETRAIARKIQWCKEVHVVESGRNKGLADSVIDGITEILDKYGSIITLEDDVVVSKYFLKFMNESLNRYELNKEVLMIGGYNFPVKKTLKQNASFFLPITTTQAWGTWKRAWDLFDSKASGYEELKINQTLREKFNLDGSYVCSEMLITQMESEKISSWAIRWWWSVFKHKGLVLFPDKSLIRNIGWDGSGRHSTNVNPHFDSEWDSNYEIINFPDKIGINNEQYNNLKEYLRPSYPPVKRSLLKRLFSWLKLG